MIINNQSNVQFTFELPDGSTQTENQNSNIVTTEVLTDNFTKIKSSNKTFLVEGETAEQTVTLSNLTSKLLTNLFFKDIMTSGATHVAGSVTINGTSYPNYDLVNGFNLPNMSPNDVLTIKYNIISNNPLTENTTKNYGNLQYSAGEYSFNENSNEITLINVSSKLGVIKEVDKTVAIKGDILHYKNTILNTGTTEKTNLFFTDSIPAGTFFVNGSVKINSISYPSYNPEAGFSLPNLSVGNNVIVEFDVEVM